MLTIVLTRETSIEQPLSETLDPELKQFTFLFNKLKQKYSVHSLLKMLHAEKYFIPCSIFNPKLSALETIVKYLVEDEKLSLKKIAELTFRTNKNIWQAYNSSKKKHPGWFTISMQDNSHSTSALLLPLEILDKNTNLGSYADKLTLLENIVKYIKEKLGLTYHEIAAALKRDDRTIWATYQRTIKKLNDSDSEK